jgi:glutathione S-transferase
VLKLYMAPGSSSMAVHIALHEIALHGISLPFEIERLSFQKKEMKTAAYLALNPEGAVPMMTVDGRPLTQVAACLFYLAKTYPEAELLPANDPETEAQAISWMSYIAAHIHPVARLGGEYVKNAWTIAEKKFAITSKGSEWALGQYSIADIHLFRLYWRMVNRPNPATGFPLMDGLLARMMARPAVQKTLEAEAAIGYELPA